MSLAKFGSEQCSRTVKHRATEPAVTPERWHDGLITGQLLQLLQVTLHTLDPCRPWCNVCQLCVLLESLLNSRDFAPYGRSGSE